MLTILPFLKKLNSTYIKLICNLPGLNSTFFRCHLIPAAGLPPTTMHLRVTVSPSNTSTILPFGCCDIETDTGGTRMKNKE